VAGTAEGSEVRSVTVSAKESVRDLTLTNAVGNHSGLPLLVRCWGVQRGWRDALRRVLTPLPVVRECPPRNGVEELGSKEVRDACRLESEDVPQLNNSPMSRRSKGLKKAISQDFRYALSVRRLAWLTM
jgi:hypothetical protein